MLTGTVRFSSGAAAEQCRATYGATLSDIASALGLARESEIASGEVADASAKRNGNYPRSRISPSCAQLATSRPSRAKILPRLNPRAWPAQGLSQA